MVRVRVCMVGTPAGTAPLASALRQEFTDQEIFLSRYDDAPAPGVSADHHLVVAIAPASDEAPGGDDVVDVWLHPTDAAALLKIVARTRSLHGNITNRRLPPDLPPRVAAYDTRWPAVARRVSSRIMAAVGPAATGVEHVGSTSVPGLAAKNIVDLQVGVASLVTFDSSESDLLAAGFVNVQRIVPGAPGVMADNPRGSGAAETPWPKRLYAGVDPDCRVIVHVREVGSPGWRYALLFRDWLTAEIAPRQEYETLKLALAQAHETDSNFDDYARSKEDWFNHAYDESEKWAAQRSWTPRAGTAPST